MAKPTTALKTIPATVPATATAEPAPARRGRGRPPGAKNVSAPKAKKGKPTQWMKWGKLAARFVGALKHLEQINALGVPGHVAPTGPTGTGALTVEAETFDDIAGVVTALQKLDAERVEVPKIPKAPKGPLFAVGDAVAMVKRYRDAYLESGLYAAGDLDILTVVAVGKKGLLVSAVGSTNQMFVRYPKHLEKR